MKVTYDMWQGVNIVKKIQVPTSNGLGFMVFWIFGGTAMVTQSVNHLRQC